MILGSRGWCYYKDVECIESRLVASVLCSVHLIMKDIIIIAGQRMV